jgi:hypothetical protein
MTRPLNVSKLTCLAALLAASVALTTSANIANAKNRHHDSDTDSNGAISYAASHQMTNEKRAQHEKKKKDKTVTRTKSCIYITSDGKRCGSGSAAGNKPPAPGKGDTDNTPTPHPSVITVSNGVKTYTLPFDPKFSVEVTKPGSITVHSGNNTVILPGGSITVHGQAVSTSLADRAGLQEIINSRGDAVFAVKPQPQSQPPTQLVPTKDGSSGGGVVDGIVGVGKTIGNGLEDVGLGLINLGGPTPQPANPKTSTTTQE